MWHFGRAKIEKNTDKLKSNAIGFYALNGNSLCDFLDDSTQESIIAFFRKIRVANPTCTAIIVVLDNISSHHSFALQAMAETLGIILIHLPPYAPNLNPTEFIWKSVKRVVSRTFIHSISELDRCIAKTWDASAVHQTFVKNWIDQFVPNIITYSA